MTAWTPGVVPDLTAPVGAAPAFEVELDADGINVVVAVPGMVSEQFGGTGPVPVLGLLDDVGITATLMPVGGGRHRLFLNLQMREAAGLAVGDRATLRLWRDEQPREAGLPDDLAAALDAAGLRAAFLAWPPSHRREYVVAIEDAKRPDTRARRIARTVEVTRDGRRS